MYKKDAVLDAILGYAADREDIRGVYLCGSRANPDIGAVDGFSDYDIVFSVGDVQTAVSKHESFLKMFGEMLIMQTPDGEDGAALTEKNKFTFLMLFQSEIRIDLTYCAREFAKNMLQTEYFSRPLLIKDCDTAHGKPLDRSCAFSQEEFTRCTNEFWWVAPYVVKGILRGQPLYAAYHIEHVLRQEFLKLASAYFSAEEKDFLPGKCCGNILKSLSQIQSADFMRSLDLSSLSAMTQSLRILMRLFSELAAPYAKTCGFEYRISEEQNVLTYCQKHLPQ